MINRLLGLLLVFVAVFGSRGASASFQDSCINALSRYEDGSLNAKAYPNMIAELTHRQIAEGTLFKKLPLGLRAIFNLLSAANDLRSKSIPTRERNDIVTACQFVEEVLWQLDFLPLAEEEESLSMCLNETLQDVLMNENFLHLSGGVNGGLCMNRTHCGAAELTHYGWATNFD